jgi:hypothetical protein
MYLSRCQLSLGLQPLPLAALLSAPTNKSDMMPESISYASNPVFGNPNIIKMA